MKLSKLSKINIASLTWIGFIYLTVLIITGKPPAHANNDVQTACIAAALIGIPIIAFIIMVGGVDNRDDE